MTNLHKTLVLAFTLSVVVPVAIIELVTSDRTGDQAREAFIQSFSGEVRQIDKAFTLLFQQVAANAAFIGNLAPVQDAVGNAPRYMTSQTGQMVAADQLGAVNAAAYDLFARFAADHPDIAYIYIGDSAGGYLQWPVANVTEKYDPRVRDWYKTAMAANGVPVLTNAYYWAADDVTTFSTVKKIVGSDPTTSGVIGIDISLDYLMSLVRSSLYGETGYLMIVEDNLNILADAKRPENNFNQLGEASGGAFASLVGKSDGIVELTIDNTDYIASIYSSPDLGWRFIGLIEKAEIDATSRDLAQVGLTIVVASLVIFVLVAVAISTSIARRIQTQHRQLEEARSEAEEASQAKSSFLATMSHEIRTPLNGIIGTAQLMTDTQLQEEQRDQLNTILTSGNTLLAIINDVLDMGKIEAGALELEETVFSLKEVVSGTLTPFAMQAEAKGIKLQTEPLPHGINFLVGDPVRIRQILWNLVSNAIKFTEEGRVVVTLDATNSGQDTAPEAQSVGITLTVRDTGPGIATDSIDQVFAPFSQADTSITRKYGGTGLGLSIIKELVTLMGGRITLESAPGEGSSFTVFLPLNEATDQQINALRLQERKSSLKSDLGLNILLAEDNPVNAAIARKVLEKLGCAVSHAENGAEAVAAFQADKPDLIFMDVHMPNMDGVTATKNIRALEHDDSRTPIIGLTADAFEENHDKFLANGMDLVLTKPFTPEKLVKAILRFSPDAAP